MTIDVFFDILMAAGPFTVFYGMGQNSCSGKLLFRGLTSTDNSATFIEDTYGLTISSAGGGGGTPIDLNEIVYGTGTGITSSFLKVDNPNYAITGAAHVNTGPRSNISRWASENSMIIGGESNELGDSVGNPVKNSIILGGLKNCLWPNLFVDPDDSFDNNVIVGGSLNRMLCSKNINSVILGGTSSAICGDFDGSANSVIHSSVSSCGNAICNTNIHSSREVCVKESCNSFVSASLMKPGGINGILQSMFCQNSSSMISTCWSQILATGSHNNIISSYGSSILGKSSTQSTIISTNTSSICSSIDVNIISAGLFSRIHAVGATKSSIVSSSNVIAGNSNLICAGQLAKMGAIKVSPGKYKLDFKESEVKNSTIIGGRGNKVFATPQLNSIVCCNLTSYSSILGGYFNTINYSIHSSIFGGEQNLIACQQFSSILGGSSNKICSGLAIGCLNNSGGTDYIYSRPYPSGALSIVGGRNNCIRSRNSIGNNDFNFHGSYLSSIIGSDCSSMERVINSSIIGSFDSSIEAWESVPNTGPTISTATILSSRCSGICAGTTVTLFNPSELTIISSCRSCIGKPLLSANMSSLSIISSYAAALVISTASSIISSAGRISSPLGQESIYCSMNSVLVSSCCSCICKSTNSVIISSYKSSIGPNVCNSVILGSSVKTLTWSNTVLVQDLLVQSELFVATASTNQFITSAAKGRDGLITSGTVIVRHGLITVI